MTFRRTPAYRAAIKQLADAIATMPIEDLAAVPLAQDLYFDFRDALERRHRSFVTELRKASVADDKQRRAERRKAGARKAAATRAKTKASEMANT
ncbi:hypothetical protein [Bradyrhizobium barranii]|uniref:hypothetical protein n=1 Tax=Bradyrhizobium TaxID=374 RepID=UPI0024AF316F|nr:hypothetical protein [Bradyrhizobium barranii]WFT95230.1 hypothetical protein QA633_44525 [Bradyrhizobium barranii]